MRISICLRGSQSVSGSESCGVVLLVLQLLGSGGLACVEASGRLFHSPALSSNN